MKELALLDTVNRQLESYTDEKQEIERELESLKEKKRIKEMEFENIKLDLQSISKHIEDSELHISSVLETISKTKDKIDEYVKREVDLSNRVQNITEKIGELKFSHIEKQKAERKEEIVTILKHTFPGLVVRYIYELQKLMISPVTIIFYELLLV